MRQARGHDLVRPIVAQGPLMKVSDADLAQEWFARHIRQPITAATTPDTRLAGLTDRERSVLELVAQGAGQPHTIRYGMGQEVDMSAFPDPVWPVLALAAIQFVDAILCIKPVAFVAACFDDVDWPRRLWWTVPPVKFAAAAGLVAGIWIPYLAAVTSVCLVAYFVVAIGMHVRARDFGRNLFLNATGMLLVCVGVTLFSFVR